MKYSTRIASLYTPAAQSAHYSSSPLKFDTLLVAEMCQTGTKVISYLAQLSQMTLNGSKLQDIYTLKTYFSVIVPRLYPMTIIELMAMSTGITSAW